ncbi:MAG: 5-formyltetrahydrofolate cyclo-ligase [Kiritimatiellia bacterium]|jgi:5-formyltetrahydrofolate cyclo-ligase
MSTTIPLDKSQLRARLRERRRAVTPEEAHGAALAIVPKLDALPGVLPGQTIAAYLSMPGEVEAAPLIAWCRRRHLRVAVPAARGDGYVWAELAGDEVLATGPMGIPEPAHPRTVAAETLDWALVPGVAFDRAGNRLGHGKGHIDRLYSAARRCRKIGIAFAWQLFDAIPHEPHDVPMERVLVP